MILNTNTALNSLYVQAVELGRTPMAALLEPGIAGAGAELAVFTGTAGLLATKTAAEARAALDAAPSSHSHGGISGDGKVGTAAGLPLFTGEDGVVVTKTAAEARAALGMRAQPSRLTALPNSGTALADNAEYRVSGAVGTYAFAWPGSPFECWLRFTTAAVVSITFPAVTAYIGGTPAFKASTQYEMSVKDGVVIVREVAAA